MKAKSVSGDEHEKLDVPIRFNCTASERKLWVSLWGKNSLRGFSARLREILNAQAKKESEL